MRRPVLLAALVALALPAAGAAATTTFLVYSDAGGSLYLANDQGAGAKTLFTGSSSATMEALDVAPDGTQVLALEAADTQQVVQVPAAAGSPKAVAGAAGATFASYSPDGARIVFSVDEYSTTSLSPGVY